MVAEGGESLKAQARDHVDAGDAAWLLTSTAMVLLMTPGLAFFYGGMVRTSSVINTMMMSIVCMGVVAVLWALVGFSLCFGEGGGAFIGDFSMAGLESMPEGAWPKTHVPPYLFAAFQMTFAIIATAIISGAIVERMNFTAYLAFTAIWSLVVYCPVCHWVWGRNGWIAELGALDFAGGTVVHEITGVSAFVMAILLGPRMQSQERAPPHNVPFVILGVALLWFGWSGFNGGSALSAGTSASLAVLNTYLAAASSMITWNCLENLHQGRMSSVGTMTGAVVGLVVITPAAGFVSPLGAMATGSVGCMLNYRAFHLPCLAAFDDSLDAFACHGVGGCIGTILAGVFSKEKGLLYTHSPVQLYKQVLGTSACLLYAVVMTVLIFKSLSCCMRMRVNMHAEAYGVDSDVHGEEAYVQPDELVPLETKLKGERDIGRNIGANGLGLNTSCFKVESATNESGHCTRSISFKCEVKAEP